MNIIELKNINKYFGTDENKVHILKDISLTIQEGEFISIIGQSGSGKSTLMNIIGCLDKATTGNYSIYGKNTTELFPDDLSELRKQKFGFIFQRYNLISSLTAQENVALPAIYAGVKEKERVERATSLLEKLELEGKIKNKPNQLSGGQQQRVSIARALMNGGEIILADEPTGALDSKSGETVMEILKKLHQKGHTIILVTHYKKVTEFADRIIDLKNGKILSDKLNKKESISKAKIATTYEEKEISYKDQLTESFKMSIGAIISHKMRSLLTMLGIIIGIASVVCVIALGKGSQEKILSTINSLGTNTMDIYNGKNRGDREGQKIKNLTVRDGEALLKQPYVESVTPNSFTSGTIVYTNQDLNGNIRGVGEQYFDVKGIPLTEGRFFTKEDVVKNNSVILIDQNIKNSLFKNKNPLGEILIFNKKPFKIIGVVSTADVMGMNTSDLNTFMPYTTLMNKVTGETRINSITVKVKDDIDSQIAEKSITELIKSRHGKKDFFIMNTDTLKKTITNTTDTMRLLISSIAVISLIVGGIGVMNIMLVSVTERTKEIGIRMAIGAKQKDILRQFLVEAALICMIGGVIGVLFSITFGIIFNSLMSNFTMIFSGYSIILAVLTSTIIGIVFGYIPAKNASALDPINALASE